MFTIIGADQKEYGPVPAEEIRQWIRDGRADGKILAKEEGSGEWRPLSTFSEFADFTAPAGPPPRIAPNYSNDPDAPIVGVAPNFSIGECLARGGSLVTKNFGILFAGTFLFWLINLFAGTLLFRFINLLSVAPFVNFIYVFIGGVLQGGLYLLFLKRIRGEPTRVTDVFAGFGVPFVQLLLVGFLTSLITGLAYFACVLPMFYLKIAWIFSLALAIDKHHEFWTAMELSRRVVTRVWFKVFILVVVAFAPFILFEAILNLHTWILVYPKYNALLSGGVPDVFKFLTDFGKITEEATNTPEFYKLEMIAEGILLLNLPFATAALMFAYEALFGTRPAPPA